MKRMLSFTIVFAMMLAMLLSVLPPGKVLAATELTTIDADETPVIVIDATFVANNSMDILIIGTPFSVTVSGNIDVTITFAYDDDNTTAEQPITVDRSTDDFSGVTAEQLYEAGEQLGWSKDGSDTEYYVPTCPFLITNKARVRVSFGTDYTFKAGGNGWYVTYDSATDTYSRNMAFGNNRRGGYAGIQVDGDASLTIDMATNLKAYGAFPLAGETVGNVTYDDDPMNVNPYFSGYYDTYGVWHDDGGDWDRPSAINSEEMNGGGAGIGGGASYDTATVRDTYTAGTPGEIVINGGAIQAVGGHLAAGIGGGVNSAATTSKIELNGGDITALGGRFACGIGDGDSITGVESPCYYEEYQIVVNGGTVKAYGGTSSAAIGTTDNLSKSARTSGVSIVLSGGTITARSGEAALGAGDSIDTKNSVATAAIGAGQSTNMKDNSISVSAAAQVSAASFSQYAISNCGTDATTVPSVNIDPDGYMYLARFLEYDTDTDVYSDDEIRIFTCYGVRSDELGNPMLRSIEEPITYYALDRDENKFYCVDKDGNLTDEDGDPSDEKVFPDTLPGLTYDYDTSSVIGEYTVPAKYKAIAITLPDPTKVSVNGTYVLHVPYEDENSDEKALLVVIQKHTAGTGSGEITIQDENNVHVQEGENGNKDLLTPNIREDVIAKELIDMLAHHENDDTLELISYYNVDFYPTKYGYTVYVPRDVNDFDLTIVFDVENVKSIAITQDGTYQGTYTLFHSSGSQTEKISLNMTDKEKSEVWIKKTDQGPQSDAYITYKVTVIRKPKYVLDISTISKIYDGKPVSPEIEHLYIAGDGLSDDIGVEEIDPVMSGTPMYKATVDYSDGRESNIREYNTTLEHHEHAINSSAITHAFIYNRRGWNQYRTQSLTVSHTLEPLTIPGEWDIVTTVTYNNKTVTATTKVILRNGEVSIAINYNDNTVGNFYLNEASSSTDGAAKLLLISDSNSSYQYELLTVNLSEASAEYYPQSVVENPNQTPIDASVIEQNRNDAIDTAVESLKEELADNHWTVKSTEATYNMGYLEAQYPFEISTPTAWGNNSTSASSSLTTTVTTYVADYHLTGRLLVTASYEHDVDVSHLLTGDDLDKVQWEYHIAQDGTEVGAGEHLEEPPKDAGTYHVKATLIADTYEAEGIEEFIIEKREITITGIKNWRTYLTEADVALLSERTWWSVPTPDDEEIEYSNVVAGESVTIDSLPNTNLSADCNSAFNYYEGEAILSISYTSTKILVLPVRLDEDNPVNKNYCFPQINLSKWYTTVDGNADSDPCDWYYFYIPGELAYYADDAVFRREEDGEWDKFWPDISADSLPLQWATDENGEFILDDDGNMIPDENETRIGYHSPNNKTHRDYVYLHTVNYGAAEARYAVDIEYGALQYTYTYEVWDVNQYQYVSVEGESQWGGNDEVNNKITITNRSNRDIWFTAQAELDSYYGKYCVAYLSTAEIQSIAAKDGRSPLLEGKVSETDVGADEASYSTFYLYLDSDDSGIGPLNSPNDGVRSTGALTITISAKDTAQTSEEGG